MKRVNNNNLLGVIPTHSGVFSSVLQLRIQGSTQRAAWECAAHYREKHAELQAIYLHPNSPHSSQIQIRGIGRFDWFANHLPAIGSVLSEIRCVEGGKGAHRGAVSLTSIPSDSFIDVRLIITCQACPCSELIDHSVIPH